MGDLTGRASVWCTLAGFTFFMQLWVVVTTPVWVQYEPATLLFFRTFSIHWKYSLKVNQFDQWVSVGTDSRVCNLFSLKSELNQFRSHHSCYTPEDQGVSGIHSSSPLEHFEGVPRNRRTDSDRSAGLSLFGQWVCAIPAIRSRFTFTYLILLWYKSYINPVNVIMKWDLLRSNHLEVLSREDGRARSSHHQKPREPDEKTLTELQWNQNQDQNFCRGCYNRWSG